MIGFVEFSRNQDLAKKVEKFYALAPVATVGHIKGGFKVLSKFALEAEVNVISYYVVFISLL